MTEFLQFPRFLDPVRIGWCRIEFDGRLECAAANATTSAECWVPWYCSQQVSGFLNMFFLFLCDKNIHMSCCEVMQ